MKKILVTYNIFREEFEELEQRYEVTFPPDGNRDFSYELMLRKYRKKTCSNGVNVRTNGANVRTNGANVRTNDANVRTNDVNVRTNNGNMHTVVLTPHIGTQTMYLRIEMAKAVCNNIIGFFENDRPVTRVLQV
jgi:hypothetical protein